MIVRKLLIIIMGIFLVLTAGVCNLYPIYLSKIKNKFGYSIKEVNLFGTFINIGLWVAFPMGYIYDKLGPKLSCLIGAFFLSGGYLSLYFILDSALEKMNLFILLIIALITGQGSALCYTTSVTTNLKNFRFKESSSIVGLLVANLALSPSIFTSYKNALDIRTSTFFLAISIFSFCVILFSGFIFQNLKRAYSDEESQKTYEKYKEKKIIRILIIINIVTLIVYTFSVIFNSMQEDRIPLVIIYPCLQSLNFIVIVLEKANIFDKLYFEAYINKKLMKTNLKPLRQNSSILNVTNESAGYDNSKKNSIITGELSIENNKHNLDNNNRFQNLPKNLDDNNNNNSRENLFNSSEDSTDPNIIKDIGSPIKKKNSFEITDEKVNENNIIKEEFSDISQENKYIENLNFINVNINFNDETKMDEKDLDKKEIDINIKELTKDLFKKDDYKHESLAYVHPQDNKINANINQLSMNIAIEKRKYSINCIELDSENVSMTLKSAVMTKEFFNLIFILIFGIGSVIANLNNITFIYESITLNPNGNINEQNKANIANASQYIILYFVFNSFTRIISGLILDHLIKMKKFLIFLIFISIMGLISQLLGLFMNKIMLLISICLAGATHGGYMTFTPIYVRNEYGLTNMGKILGVLTTGCAIGSFFIDIMK